MEYASREEFLLLELRHLHVSSQARVARPFRCQRVLSRVFRSCHGAGARDGGHRHVGGRAHCAIAVAWAARSRLKTTNSEATAQTKTPPPEGDGVLHFEHRKRKISCPWQAWQRPTLPG